MKKITLFLILVMGFSLLNAQGYKNRVKSKTNKTKLVKKIITYEDFQNATSKPQSGFTEYVTSVGDTIKLNGKVKLGSPSRDGNSFLYVWTGSDFNGWTYAHISAQGWESEVVKLNLCGAFNINQKYFDAIMNSFNEYRKTGNRITSDYNKENYIADLKEWSNSEHKKGTFSSYKIKKNRSGEL